MLSLQPRWKKPTLGELECNVDASFLDALYSDRHGMCIRDDTRNFVMAKTMWLNRVCSSDIGEVLGFSHVIHWVCDLQLTNVDF